MISKSKIKQLEKLFTKEQNILLAFVFGSVLTNNQHEESDVDIAVLYHDKPDYHTFSTLANNVEDILHQNIDLSSLNDTSPVFRMQVLSKGKLVYMHDSKTRDYFIIKTVNEYDDLNYYRNIQEKNLLKGRMYAR